MEKLFLGFYDSYWSVINENMTSTGKPMMVRNNYVHLHNGANFFYLLLSIRNEATAISCSAN